MDSTHTRGQGSKHIASRKKDRLISLFLNISGVPLMAQISGNVEVISIPTLRVEVKVPTVVSTEDAKPSGHAGSDHPQRPYTNTPPLWWGSILVAHIHIGYMTMCATWQSRQPQITINQNNFFNVLFIVSSSPTEPKTTLYRAGCRNVHGFYVTLGLVSSNMVVIMIMVHE